LEWFLVRGDAHRLETLGCLKIDGVKGKREREGGRERERGAGRVQVV